MGRNRPCTENIEKMPKKNLDYFLYCFENLRRDARMGGAPHKPVLLLSLIDQFENFELAGNRVLITPELIASFKATWSTLVESQHSMSFAMPFFHMSSEPFWKLIPNDGCGIWVESKSAMRRIRNLQTAVRYAEIDDSLALLLEKKEYRATLRQFLLSHYFPQKSSLFINENAGKSIVNAIEKEIESENPNAYQNHLKVLSGTKTQEEFEEEIAIRGGIFKRKIPQIYDYTCCISGFGISTNFSLANLVEACHIRPISQSFDDTLSNGIALCPTLHKAFDAGIFSISDDYEILVSKKIREKDSSQNISQFDGLKVRLPKEQRHWPSPENLKWHREKVFEKGR